MLDEDASCWLDEQNLQADRRRVELMLSMPGQQVQLHVSCTPNTCCQRYMAPVSRLMQLTLLPYIETSPFLFRYLHFTGSQSNASAKYNPERSLGVQFWSFCTWLCTTVTLRHKPESLLALLHQMEHRQLRSCRPSGAGSVP